MRIPNRPGGTRNKLPGSTCAMRFLTRTRPGLILLALAAAAATVAVPTSASASTVASPVVGYTYVDGNTAPANTIDGFARHADGSLTPLAGSPFSAGGAGLGSGLASQGAIQVTSDGRYCWLSTPAATRSRFCASPRTACRCLPASRYLRAGSRR